MLLAVLWRLRYKLSFRDVAEMLLQRSFEVTHETIRKWEFRFAPLLADQLRARRRGRAGESWYLDEPAQEPSAACFSRHSLSIESSSSPSRSIARYR